jgi:hypothetical protein
MPKQVRGLPEHSHAIPSKTERERLAAPDRAQPLDPRVILQRAALAPQSLRPADILRLQQTLGNRAVGLLLSGLVSSPPMIQAKLTVNAPGDEYEREADRVAEQVMRMPAVPLRGLGHENAKPDVMTGPQPSPEAGGAFAVRQAFERPLPSALREEHENAKPDVMTGPQPSPEAGGAFAVRQAFERPLNAALREEHENAKPDVMTGPQPSPEAGGAFAVRQAFERPLNAARRQGQPLPTALREDFETKFGADFSGVRVHADALAHQLNRSVQARAFTTGQDVFFRHGAYEPGSRVGQKLIAHELTHVLQQKRGTRRAEVEYNRENCVQRKFGFELEMEIPYGRTHPTNPGTEAEPNIIQVDDGKDEAEQAKHSSGTFKIAGDKNPGGDKEKINSIVELVTEPIDESQLASEEEVRAHFEDLEKTGLKLAEVCKAKTDRRVSYFSGFSDDKHWICPTKAGFRSSASVDTAYAQGTYGLDMAGLGGFIKSIAGRTKEENPSAKHVVLEQSLFSEKDVTEAISKARKSASTAGIEEGPKPSDVQPPLTAPPPRPPPFAGLKIGPALRETQARPALKETQARLESPVTEQKVMAGPMAGYLSYIATMIISGKEHKKAGKAVTKNLVPLLNKAKVAEPELGPPAVRQALRDLLMEKCGVNKDTVLFPAATADINMNVYKLLDAVLPKEGKAEWKTMLGETFFKEEQNKEEEKGGKLISKRDVIFEERRIYPSGRIGERLKVKEWIPVIIEYWKMLKAANRWRPRPEALRKL